MANQVQRVSLKLGTMRKPQDWIVYPVQGNNPDERQIQCDTRIARFNIHTGVGLLSRSVPNGAYGIHLSPRAGAVHLTVERSVIDAVLAATPQSGDRVDGRGMVLIA